MSKDTNKHVMFRSAKHNENNEVGKGDYKVQRVEWLGYRVHCMGRKGFFVGTLEERECVSHADSQEKNIHYKESTNSEHAWNIGSKVANGQKRGVGRGSSLT